MHKFINEISLFKYYILPEYSFHFFENLIVHPKSIRKGKGILNSKLGYP